MFFAKNVNKQIMKIQYVGIPEIDDVIIHRKGFPNNSLTKFSFKFDENHRNSSQIRSTNRLKKFKT